MVSDPKEGRVFFPVAIGAGCIWLALLGWGQRERFLAGVNDFAQLYAGATLVGTPELYSPEANKRVHREVIGVVVDSVYYSRPPFYAFLLKPLAALPYRAAYWVFQSVSFLCLAWFLWAFARGRVEVALFACLYPPLIIVLLNCQDAGIALALAGAGYLLLERDKPFAAGLVWSMCSIKPHLFVFLPVVLIVHRKWRALAGGVAGGCLLVALSFAAQGRNWISEYLTLLRDPQIHPRPDYMPNFQALRVAIDPHLSESWLVPAILLAGALALIAIWGAGHWALAFALALPASLLVSYHAYVQDTVLLLLTLALFLRHGAAPPMVRFAALAVTPIPPLMGLAGVPWSAVYPVYLTLWIGLAAFRAVIGDGRPTDETLMAPTPSPARKAAPNTGLALERV